MDVLDSKGKEVDGVGEKTMSDAVVYSRRKVDRRNDMQVEMKGVNRVIDGEERSENVESDEEGQGVFMLDEDKEFVRPSVTVGVEFHNQGTEVKDMSDQVELSGLEGVMAATMDSGKMVKLPVMEHEFYVGDLVWGKVNSYPWWPGQIFDISSSSKKAKKYFKKGKILIAYFGDQSFAWIEASRIKHFQAHFTRLEKQSNLESFHNAVDGALEEVSRRIEFGLACSCVSEDVHARIKTQIFVNPGIREESSRMDGGDRFSTAESFNPMKLVEYVKALASFQNGGVDRVEHVIAQAQLLAISHWKGYSQLPEFNMVGKLLENDADSQLSVDVQYADQAMISDFKDDVQVLSGEGKLKTRARSSNHKRKHISADSKNPSKKEKRSLDLMAGKSSYVSNGETGSERMDGEKSLFSVHSSKRKATDSMPDDLALKQRSNLLPSGITNKSPQSKRTYRVGESILRVANQLNRSAAALKDDHETSQKSVIDNISKEKSPDSSKTLKESFVKKLTIESSSPDEMLSNLNFAAHHPMAQHCVSNPMIGILSDFRNSVSSDRATLRKHGESAEQASVGNHGEKSTKSEVTETSELEYKKNSDLTDMEIQSNLEEPRSLENQNDLVEVFNETPSKKDAATSVVDTALESSNNLDFEQKTAGGSRNLETVTPEHKVDESCADDIYHTALVLKFRSIDSVPSATELNQIFSRFVPENESGTELIQKGSLTKVVFKKRAYAELAFNVVERDRIFGSALVSFRLGLIRIKPRKAKTRKKKQ